MNTAHTRKPPMLLLMPAYGQTYYTTEAMAEAWDKGDDFKVYLSGRYTSVRDVAMMRECYNSVLIVDPHSPVEYTVY